MKKFIVIIFCIMLASCRQADFPSGIEHVVIIGLDGLSKQHRTSRIGDAMYGQSGATWRIQLHGVRALTC